MTSFADFEHYFGGLAEDSPMSYAGRDFFDNGGMEAWVVRRVIAEGALARDFGDVNLGRLRRTAREDDRVTETRQRRGR